MAPRCAPPWAGDRSRIGLPRRWSAPPRRLFFQGWPALLPPGGNRRLVALRRACPGPLHAVAQTMEESVDVGRMVGDAERASNDLSDPLARPDLPAKAVRLWPTSNERRNLGALLLAQSWRR